MDNETIGLVIRAAGRTGVLHQLTGVIARHDSMTLVPDANGT